MQSHAKTTVVSSRVKLIALLFLLASLPFLLRLDINTALNLEKSAEKIYRTWRMSLGFQTAHYMPPVYLESVKSSQESDVVKSFQRALRNEFTMTAVPGYPKVQVFFNESSILKAKISLYKDASSEPVVWEGSARVLNNGFLVAFFLAILLMIFSLPRKVVYFSLPTVLFFWFTDWNLLKVAHNLYDVLFLYLSEFIYSFSQTINPFFMIESYSFLLILALSVLFSFSTYLNRKKKIKDLLYSAEMEFVFYSLFEMILFYLCLEVFFPLEVNFFKLYLAALPFRFFSVFYLLFSFQHRELFLNLSKKSLVKNSYFYYLLPLLIFMIGAHDWVELMWVDLFHKSLIPLKIFLVTFLLSFLTGQRWAALVIAFVPFLKSFPPGQGHMEMGFYSAFFWEAAFLGSFFSPFAPQAYSRQKVLGFLALPNAWLMTLSIIFLGFFLSALLLPAYISWSLLLMCFVLLSYSLQNKSVTKV